MSNLSRRDYFAGLIFQQYIGMKVDMNAEEMADIAVSLATRLSQKLSEWHDPQPKVLQMNDEELDEALKNF